MTAVPVVAAFGDPPAAGAIERGLAALDAGGVVGIPTDTVYGLAADPFAPEATDRIFLLKDRPRSVDLPVLVADVEQGLSLCAQLPPYARELMDRFWPGALTLVVSRRAGLGLHLGGDGTTVGLRCPDHAVARALCGAGGPLATTSANRHGSEPATTAGAVAEIDGVSLVLDSGPCPIRPSTVVACTAGRPVLLRAGTLAWRDIVAR